MEETHRVRRGPLSIKLWPPSENTRSMLAERMVKNLITPSVFSRKYGLLGKEEADENAKKIEQLAFAAANHHFENEPDGPDNDGTSSVHLYAKESSRLMLELLKRGPTPAQVDPTGPPAADPTHEEDTILNISGGLRAFIEGKEAEELLQPLLTPGNRYTKICFSNRSFGLDAARVAAPILSSVAPHLKEVDLSDFIAGRPEAEALEVMSEFSKALSPASLRRLNLSDNALGEKGVRAFSSLLTSQEHLEELFFMNNGISEGAARAISDLIPATRSLKLLHFHNNMTGDEGASAVSDIVRRSPLLEDFRCSSTRVAAEGGAALATALGSCPRLLRLDLRDNMFGVEAAAALARSVSGFSNLREVYLSYLNMGDEGAEAVAGALSGGCPLLEVVEMAGNEITEKGAAALAECVEGKRGIRRVDVSENEMKDGGAVALAGAVERGGGRVEELDVSSNGIRDVGGRELARVVGKKEGFKVLNLNGNLLSEECVEEVKKVLGEKLGPMDDNDPLGDGDDGKEDVEDDEHLHLGLEKLQVTD